MTDLDRYRTALIPGFASREQAFHAMQTVVFELLLEVEAIRRTLADGDTALRARYAKHYRETYLASHSSAGISDPVSRALAGYAGDGPLRECALLDNLGVDLEHYRREVEYVGTLT
jgi:hypothetical protein